MTNKDDFRSLMKRARWDRLIGALIVLILIIVMFVSCVKSCAGEPDAVDTGNSDIIPPETIPTTEAVVDNSMAVFLSPSTQEDNVYACDETVTEESAMFELTDKVKAKLEAEGITVYVCGADDNVKAKISAGNELKCGAYVALHSNAGGETGTDQGTECYYNSKVEGSQALAENIYNRVAELTPTEDRGLKDETQRDLYEIFNNKTPCCLLEVEFHDTVELSQWILDNEDSVAECIKEGIIAFLNAQSSSSPVIGDSLPDDSVDEGSIGGDDAMSADGEAAE